VYWETHCSRMNNLLRLTSLFFWLPNIFRTYSRIISQIRPLCARCISFPRRYFTRRSINSGISSFLLSVMRATNFKVQEIQHKFSVYFQFTNVFRTYVVFIRGPCSNHTQLQNFMFMLILMVSNVTAQIDLLTGDYSDLLANWKVITISNYGSAPVGP
jgi:hypothetical protein